MNCKVDVAPISRAGTRSEILNFCRTATSIMFFTFVTMYNQVCRVFVRNIMEFKNLKYLTNRNTQLEEVNLEKNGEQDNKQA